MVGYSWTADRCDVPQCFGTLSRWHLLCPQAVNIKIDPRWRLITLNYQSDETLRFKPEKSGWHDPLLHGEIWDGWVGWPQIFNRLRSFSTCFQGYDTGIEHYRVPYRVVWHVCESHSWNLMVKCVKSGFSKPPTLSVLITPSFSRPPGAHTWDKFLQLTCSKPHFVFFIWWFLH